MHGYRNARRFRFAREKRERQLDGSHARNPRAKSSSDKQVIIPKSGEAVSLFPKKTTTLASLISDAQSMDCCSESSSFHDTLIATPVSPLRLRLIEFIGLCIGGHLNISG